MWSFIQCLRYLTSNVLWWQRANTKRCFQANMLEGGGKTPILTPMELEELGFKIVAYPLSLIGVAISAMQVCSALDQDTDKFQLLSRQF